MNGQVPHLAQHLKARSEALRSAIRPSRFLKGTVADLNQLVKLNRYRPVQAEIVIVQPGLSKNRKTQAQAAVLAAALTYLKETVGVDVGIICSE